LRLAALNGGAIADSLGRRDPLTGRLDRQNDAVVDTAESSALRILLQGIVGCGAAAGGRRVRVEEAVRAAGVLAALAATEVKKNADSSGTTTPPTNTLAFSIHSL
jgi:hypothetical protein